MKVVSFKLSQQSIQKAIKEIERYKKDLRRKCTVLVDRLADEGITTAQGYATGIGKYITFTKQVNTSVYGVKGSVTATSPEIKVRWVTNDGIQEVDVSPLLMAEFGSGAKASDAQGLPNADKAQELGMGRGTFPDQTHAFDDGGWSWLGLDGEWHHSEGTEPTMPMYEASQQMIQEVVRIAREVFNS